MRFAIFNKRSIASVVIFCLLMTMLGSVMPFESFALEDDTSLKERNMWFTYGCTDCLGEVHACSEDEVQIYDIDDTTCPEYFGVTMMMCDTDHVIQVSGDGASNDITTFTSRNTDVLEVDSEGNVTLKKTGKCEILATVAGDSEFAVRTVSLTVTVDKHEGWDSDATVYYEGRSPALGLDLDTSDGSQQLVLPLRPGASASYSSEDTNVVLVDANGVVTPVAAGTARLRFDIDDGGGKYKAGYFNATITVTGEDLRSDQEISGDTGPFTIDCHDSLDLNHQAMTDLSYSVYNGGSLASVDQDGIVTFTGPGSAVIKVVAAPSAEYHSAELLINITARDYEAEAAAAQQAEEEAAAAAEKAAAEKAAAEAAAAAQKAAEETALAAEIVKAQSLTKPSLKVKARKGRKNKLTWGKVENADGYMVYVRYPGKKKYVKAVTKSASIKSVTHKGLSRRKVYRYKVRAFKVVNGKYYYGPYSKVRKAKVK